MRVWLYRRLTALPGGRAALALRQRLADVPLWRPLRGRAARAHDAEQRRVLAEFEREIRARPPPGRVAPPGPPDPPAGRARAGPG
jgi:hypothetical protein